MCMPKFLKWESNMSSWFFPAEIFLMLKCCHENSPLIHGIVCTPKMILATIHTYSIAVYSALYKKPITEVTIDVWKRILYDLLSAVQHLHLNILHSDIKNNNILVENVEQDKFMSS